MDTVKNVVRVATWNLHEGLPAQARTGSISSEVRDEITALTDKNSIDVLALQEVDFDHGRTSELLDTIVSETALKYFATFPISESSFFKEKNAGIAIVSRFPLGCVVKVMLPNPHLCVSGRMGMRSHDKGFLAARVEADGFDVTVVALHALPFHIFKREAAAPEFRYIWKQLAHDIESLDFGPLIVCGDFNTPRRDLVLDEIRTEMTRAIGDRPTFENFAYDDILYASDYFTQLAVGVVRNFSDHALCIAELEPVAI